jgi:formylglycine-generating enzyme required for sulfatase activity
MAGNVWEWVADRYSDTYYGEYMNLTTKTPPEGPNDGGLRVIRGGGFNNDWNDLKVTNREGHDPTSYASHISPKIAGFRGFQNFGSLLSDRHCQFHLQQYSFVGNSIIAP